MSELITMDREYVTRDGKPVRVLCVDLRGDEWTVVALVQNECRERLITYRANGRYSAISESKEDLIPKPKRHKRTAWMNVYPDYPGNVHESRAEADGLSGAGRIACLELHLDFAEGEGLEVRDE